jgi:TrmH family RNA methyltransferase
MVLSKNRIKYLASLKMKKFRDEYGQFLAEGDKIVSDVLRNGIKNASAIASTPEWLKDNISLTGSVKEIYEASLQDLGKISSFETAPDVIGLFDIPEYVPDFDEIGQLFSIGLDSIQDPGNLGTIIRTADWFGISNIFCNHGCADVYNPKTIQASMGAVFNVKVHYTDLYELLGRLSDLKNYTVIGTYLNGEHLNNLKDLKKGIMLFGNESRGIATEYSRYIKNRVTIPPFNTGRVHVESLNVASSVAIALAWNNLK